MQNNHQPEKIERLKRLTAFRRLLIMALTAAGIIFAALQPSAIFADGFIVIPEPVPLPGIVGPRPFPLEVKYHHVNVAIDGRHAETTIDQVFHNPTGQTLEGYYLFPIPARAVIDEFNMEINGVMTPAELLGAEKARDIYEEIVRNMRDPALLEYSGSGLYRVRIFPIEPNSDKQVTITYSEVLDIENNTMEYLYPLNTEKFSSAPLDEASVTVDIHSETDIKTVYVPTHEAEIVRDSGGHVIAEWEAEDVKPNTDFKLYFTTDPDEVGMTVLAYGERNDDGYFFISATPSIDYDERRIIEKDITFVLDVSGSMAGDKLRHAKKALIYCIENLNDGDRFEVIRFSTEAFALFKGLESANAGNRAEAEEFVQELRPVGGTNIEEALTIALDAEMRRGRPSMIVFITDGKPTIGEIEEDALLEKIQAANDDNVRIFTFGIGDEINTHLLDKITEMTKSTRTYVAENEDIELKIASFYDKVRSPVMSGLELELGENIDIYQSYPKELPDFFRGSTITVFGRYRGVGDAAVTLSGTMDGERNVYVYEASFPDNDRNHDFIPPIWASRRIGYLLDLIRLHGENEELVDEVTQLARTHGIITPYTSYLILEDEEIRAVENDIPEELTTLRGTGALDDKESIEKYEEEYNTMQEKSGGRSVQVSQEFDALNRAENTEQTRQGASRMGYRDSSGEEHNLTSRVKNIQGRAVYQQSKFWVDSRLQEMEPQQTKRIEFASDEYFSLLENNAEVGQFLALGRNVRFYYNDTYYEVYEAE